VTVRRRRLLVLALLLGLGGLFVARLPLWSAGVLSSQLQAFFHRPVTVGQVRYHLFPFEVEVEDVRVAGATPEAPPFLEVPKVVAAFSRPPLDPEMPQSFWDRKVVLSRLRVERPRIRVNAFENGGDDIPAMGTAGPAGADARIERLTVDRGELILNHQRVPLELDLPRFRGRLASRRPGVLGGTFSFGMGTARFGSAPAFPVGTDVALTLEGRRLTVESGRLRAPDTEIEYRGQIQLAARPQGLLTVRGTVDLAMLDAHVLRSGFGLHGRGRYDGTASVDGSRLRLKGRLEGTEGVFDGVPVPRYAGEVAWDSEGAHLRRFEVQAFGGTGVLDVEVPPGKGVARLEATLRGVDAEALSRKVFDIGAAGVGASAGGEVRLRWPRGRIRDLSGRVALDLSSRSDGRTPLAGRLVWRAEDGVQLLEAAELKTPATQARLVGRIARDDRADIAVEAESTDLAASDALGQRVRVALGNPKAAILGFSGTGTFRGRWRGTVKSPIFEGRFSGPRVEYLGVRWGGAEWTGVADGRNVRSHPLVLRRPGGELRLEGEMETGDPGGRDALDMRVRFTRWPAADFVKALDLEVKMDGLLSGEAELSGRRSAPEGPVRIASDSGRYYDVPYSDLEVEARLQGALTEVRRGRAGVGGGTVTFRGTVTDDDVYDGTATAADMDIGEMLPPVSEVRWGGQVSGTATLQGTLERPRLRARVTSPRLFLGDEGVGALEAELLGAGDGTIGVEARCRSPRVDLELRGSVGAAAPHAASLDVTARGTSVDPFLRAVYPSLPAAVGLVTSGDVRLSGPLDRAADLQADASLSSLEVLLPEYPVKNRDPLRFVVDHGAVEVRNLHLSGEGTDLAVEGRAVVVGDGALDLSVDGAADLRALSPILRPVRSRGAARVGMKVSGTRAHPRVEGQMDVEGAGLRVRGFPHGLEGLRGSVRFNEEAAHFSEVTGTVGGGPVELQGQAAYAAGKPTSFDVRAVGRGLVLHYPEGLRSVVDADLRLLGTTERPWVTGSVDVKQATWTRRYDLASELLTTREQLEERVSLEEGLRYDVKVRAPGTLRIDNNLATLQARADLSLQGSYEQPVVLGRAEIERGRVYFQGNTYVIRRGTLDFSNPQRIDPLFDIEAESRIRSYRVTLKINGTLERAYPTLSSDPPLTAVQILNLLAGADESDVASLSTSQTRQASLAATGAATLAAGRIAEEVGLERGAERLFGLNRFSIDPSLVKGDVTNPSARISLGKRITPDLNVLYSIDLRGVQDPFLSVEYTLSDRFSLSVSRADPGGYGFDLRLRQSK
jgi:translocation-and-assembly-module (TAM) inner membrane subunit TamB-like protein